MKPLLMTNLLEMAKKVNLKQVDENLLPSAQVGEGEKVVGTLPDNLKRLFIAILQTNQDLRATCEGIHARFRPQKDAGKKPSDLPVEDRRLLDEHNAQHEWTDLAIQIFWMEVVNAFPELGRPATSKGLRQGWQVVSWNPIQDALRSAFDALGELLQ